MPYKIENKPVFRLNSTFCTDHIISLVRAAYYSIEAMVFDGSLIFPYNAPDARDIDWLISPCNPISEQAVTRILHTGYKLNETDYNTQLTATYKTDINPLSLSAPEINERWEFIRKILPPEIFKKYGDDFDIVKWYSQIISSDGIQKYHPPTQQL